LRSCFNIAAALLITGLASLAICAPNKAAAAPGDVVWEASYSSRPDKDNDHAAGLAIDGQGNLLITGSRSDKDGNYDYLTVKYGPYGTTKWADIFDNSWYDVGRCVAVDLAGDVIVAGASNNLENPRNTYSGSYFTDYRIVKYDPAGKPITEMTASGNHRDNDPASVAVDKDGGIFVTGSAKDASGVYPMYYTVKFAPDGTLLWERPDDWVAESYASGLKLDNDGSIVVTGYTMNPLTGNYDIRTLRITQDGINLLMDVTYNDLYYGEKAHGLCLDGEGNIIITGETDADGGVTLTLKYRPDGKLLWASRYRDSEFKNRGNAVAVDKNGRIYVAGRTFKENQEGDYLLLVYDKDGGLLGTRTYSFGGDDDAEDVAVDTYGNIVLTGTTRMPDKPGVFRTIRVEGYPLKPGPSIGLPAGAVLKSGPRLALSPIPMVRNVVLVSQRCEPKAANSPVRFVADPIGLPGEYEYRFFVMGRSSAHHWDAVSDYTDRNFWVLPDTDNPAKIKVQVRTKGSKLIYEAQVVLDLQDER
jgi:uncharacterized delta-60 repeat protein